MEQHLAQQIAALKEENRELREELHREQLQSQSRVEEELSSTVINLIAAVAAVADDVDVLGSPVAQRKRNSPAAAAVCRLQQHVGCAGLLAAGSRPAVPVPRPEEHVCAAVSVGWPVAAG